ncbi:MAG: helix-turn-helix domain-containing protein [Leptospiraceae bacterium]|nr:helix-turn-helix transcriptional regulator [Leptospiraceae bacterium]MCK6381839.1 helix-turn-helix domain-containing protein [Leptospiraceae bacterium]
MKERLKNLINLLGITQKEFSERIGFSSNILTEILSGRTKTVSKKVIKSILATFPVREEWLLTGEGDPLKSESEKEKLLDESFLLLPEYAEIRNIVARIPKQEIPKVVELLKIFLTK